MRAIDADYLKEHLMECAINGRPLHRMYTELDDLLIAIDDVPTIEPDRKAIEDEVAVFWKTVRDIDALTLDKIFGEMNFWTILNTMPYKEAKTKYEAWKKEEEIRVGDEVIPLDTQYDTMVVTKLWVSECHDEWIDTIASNGKLFSFLKTSIKKTGRHFDEIEELLKKMRESENEIYN